MQVDTEARVKKVVAEQLGVDPAKVTGDKHLESDLGADSLDRVELGMALEDEFGLEISDSEQESMTTVKALIELVDSL